MTKATVATVQADQTPVGGVLSRDNQGMQDFLSRSLPRLAMVCILSLISVVGLLQLTPPCSDWREWKASKQGPGFHTLELMTPAFFCIGSRQP